MLKKQSRLFFYKEEVFFWKILNILHTVNIPFFDKIKLSFNIRNLKDIEDSVITRFFYYLEVITSQKIFLRKFTKGNLKKKRKDINLTGQVTLRGIKLYNFLEFFYLFIVPNLKKNFFKVNRKVDNSGNLTLNLKDLSLLPGLTEEFHNERQYPIKIDIILNSSSLKKSIYILKEFGF